MLLAVSDWLLPLSRLVSEETDMPPLPAWVLPPLSWLAVRAGYRADVKGNDSNVFTGGVGFAPFSTVHVDLMGLYGEDETWGAGAQLSMTF